MKKLYDRIIEKKTYFKKSEGIYNLPDVGNPINNREFSGGVKKIKEYYELKSIPEYSSHEKKRYSFTSGDPINYKAFKPALDNIIKTTNSNQFYKYPQTTGNDEDKKHIIDYCNVIGINKNEDNEKLNKYNITFTSSTTHAFSMIIELISKPGDVIVISSPNYGIFDFIPERLGVKVVTIPLRKENNYSIY